MEQTLDAAHRLFAERGYAEVKMDEIAAAVGVTKPLLYTYFGNKERLYIACMERAGDALTETVADGGGGDRQPRRGARRRRPRLLRLPRLRPRRLGGALRRDAADPAASSPSASPPTAARILALSRRLDPGASCPSERRAAARVEIEALSAALLGAAEALARWWLRTEAISAEEAAELLIATIEPGLRARSGAPPTSQPNRKGTTPE